MTLSRLPLVVAVAPILGSGLAGCHLFTAVDITCVQGMPCAEGGQESGVETGDTAVEPSPTVGWVVGAVGTNDAFAEAYAADGTLLKSWPGLDDAFEGIEPNVEERYRGALAYNPDIGAGILAFGGYFVTLNYDGSLPTPMPVVGGDVYDVELRYGGAWFAVGTQVYDYVFDPGEFAALFGGQLEDARGLAYADELLYVSACGGGTPDLWVLDATGEVVDRLADFDTNCGRGDNVFVGPGGEPWQCNSAGALYRLASVVEGDLEPAETVGGVNDVRDCAYDPGDDSFLLLDGARGLLRYRGGVTSQAWEPPAGMAPARAGFFTAGG